MKSWEKVNVQVIMTCILEIVKHIIKTKYMKIWAAYFDKSGQIEIDNSAETVLENLLPLPLKSLYELFYNSFINEKICKKTNTTIKREKKTFNIKQI